MRSSTRIPAGILAALVALSAGPAAAGEAADALAGAEAAAAAGDAGAAWTAFDRGVELFWAEAPLAVRTAAFVGNDGGAPPAVYAGGDALRILLAPVGYGWTPIADAFRIRIVVDVELATRAGVVLADVGDFATLEHTGADRTREFSAVLTVTLPELRPDDYELRLVLRDAATGKTTAVVLPFRAG
ncbi:MAG: hypothetical protein IT534_00950 [Bauldia sp.]|nr:hypothetical protein [Bauldia sp.]